MAYDFQKFKIEKYKQLSDCLDKIRNYFNDLEPGKALSQKQVTEFLSVNKVLESFSGLLPGMGGGEPVLTRLLARTSDFKARFLDKPESADSYPRAWDIANDASIIHHYMSTVCDEEIPR